MIVYRGQRSRVDPQQLIMRTRNQAVALLSRSAISHDEAVEVLIQMGRLETALVDAAFPTQDGVNPLAETLRRGSIAAGHLVWHSWHDESVRGSQFIRLLLESLSRVDLGALPRSVEVSVPEGYAYYGLYPEMYIQATKKFARSVPGSSAVCIGLRSIGTSLSAAVAAALEQLNWKVQSWTLRPHGHPYDRVPSTTPELQERLRSDRGAHVLIVDEGPGISGSSLGGTARFLTHLGIPDEQIVLFPGWSTDGSQLKSAVAREHWGRHRQFSSSFEETWLQTRRLGFRPSEKLHDVSAGTWRQAAYPSPSCYPAVHPQHERRKYLLASPGTDQPGQLLLKFVGLGEPGRVGLERARILSERGFTPKPLKIRHGFMASCLIPGTPVPGGHCSPELTDRIASYLAHLVQEHAAPPTTDDATLHEMSVTNLTEGLGEKAARDICGRLPDVWAERPVALDGRMQPHEWIATEKGLFKTDAIDHHNDHFLPGAQDIAWDLAGAALEFELDRVTRRALVHRYKALTADRTITQRLPHYATAYLAFRLGYATLAQEVLGAAQDDGLRFGALASRYRALLLAERGPSTAEFWNV